MAKLKDFIDDWQIDTKNKSATHKSGIEFKYIQNGYEGKQQVEILNLPKWFSIEIEKGKGIEDCKNLLNEMNAQFTEIYQKVITPQKSALAIKLEKSNER